jgi:hypothetical protein
MARVRWNYLTYELWENSFSGWGQFLKNLCRNCLHDEKFLTEEAWSHGGLQTRKFGQMTKSYSAQKQLKYFQVIRWFEFFIFLQSNIIEMWNMSLWYSLWHFLTYLNILNGNKLLPIELNWRQKSKSELCRMNQQLCPMSLSRPKAFCSLNRGCLQPGA